MYVDDIILTGSSDSLLAQFVSQLAVQFSIKDLGSLNYFLGIQVCRFSDGIFFIAIQIHDRHSYPPEHA